MSEQDVAPNGSCAHCGGTHYGSGRRCPFRDLDDATDTDVADDAADAALGREGATPQEWTPEACSAKYGPHACDAGCKFLFTPADPPTATPQAAENGDDSVTACGLTRRQLHEAFPVCAHVIGAVPGGVKCRKCREMWTGAEADAMWQTERERLIAGAPTATPEQGKGETHDCKWRREAYAIAEAIGYPRESVDLPDCDHVLVGAVRSLIASAAQPMSSPSPLSLADVPRYWTQIDASGRFVGMTRGQRGLFVKFADIEALVQRLEKRITRLEKGIRRISAR